VRYQAALHPELSFVSVRLKADTTLVRLKPDTAFVRLKPDTTSTPTRACFIYADARLFRLAGRAGLRAAAVTRFDATVGFERAAIDRRAPFTSDGADGGSRR
jgi:hypothetical protein